MSDLTELLNDLSELMDQLHQQIANLDEEVLDIHVSFDKVNDKIEQLDKLLEEGAK